MWLQNDIKAGWDINGLMLTRPQGGAAQQASLDCTPPILALDPHVARVLGEPSPRLFGDRHFEDAFEAIRRRARAEASAAATAGSPAK